MDDKVYLRPYGSRRAMPKLRLAVGALALLLVLPLGAAATAHGQLDAGAVTLAGPAAFHADAADLRWTGDRAPTLDVHAAKVHVERHGYRTQTTANGLVGVYSEPVNERFDHADATLSIEGDAADSLLALRSAMPLDATMGDATVRPAAFASVVHAFSEAIECNGDDPMCWTAAGVAEVAAAQATLQVPAQTRIVLRGPTLVVGGATYASGRAQTTDGATVTTDDTWLLVVLDGAAGTLDIADGDARLYAASPTLHTSRATLDGATGRLDDGARAWVAKGEAMDVGGDLDVTPGPVAPAAPDGTKPLTYAPSFDVKVQGDVKTVSVRALPFYEASPAASLGLAAALLAIAGATAYAWPLLQFHGTSALLPFYTRLKPPQLLDNDVRNGIYEIIRANPGISARAVHRQSDQSWGTVVYHLRQLEKHNLVVSRTVGRTRNYYENHGKYRGMEVQLACLRSERARVLARLVLTTPGIAQEELVERSTYPQPTTSYYVRKLKSAGLVEERRDGRYARYHPVGDIARFLELADHSAPEAAA